MFTTFNHRTDLSEGLSDISTSFSTERPPPYSCISPSREPRFIVGPFEPISSPQPSPGFPPPEDLSFRIEVTDIREKDLLRPPTPGLPWFKSSQDTSYEGSERETTGSEGPRLPGIFRFLLRLVIFLESAAVLSLTTHSVSIFTRTQTIRFGGIEPAWPDQIELFPARFRQAVACTSLSISLLVLVHLLWRRFTTPPLFDNYYAIVCSGLMMGLWFAAAIVSRQHPGHEKGTIASWACPRAGTRPIRVVDYNLICAEQV